MYVIIVYDVAVERVAKVCQFLRRFLHWKQNSVFEGEITESELVRIKLELSKLIDPNYDSILIYKFSHKFLTEREHLGIDKSPETTII